MRRFLFPVAACLLSRRRLVCNCALRLVEGRVVAVRCCVLPVGCGFACSRARYHMLQLIGWVGIKPALLLFYRPSPMLADSYFLGFRRARRWAPSRGNASAVAGMASSHVGLPSTSRNALTGAGLTGCCAGRPLAETPGRRRQRNKPGWHGRYLRGNAPSAARSTQCPLCRFTHGFVNGNVQSCL